MPKPHHQDRPKRSEELRESKRRPAQGAERGGKERPPLPPGIASRDAALALIGMTRRGLTLDQALEACNSFTALEGSDRAFARALASITLRRQGMLDEVVSGYLREPLKPRQDLLRDILRITAAQLILLDTDDHAAAWSAVELTKLRAETRAYSKLVNAVSRRLTETGKDKAADVPLRADTPGWLWRKLARSYGAGAAAQIAEAHRAEPPLDITLKDPAAEISWPDGMAALRLGPRTVRMKSTQVRELPGYQEGEWWVQDVAATLPAHVLGAEEGETVYDLCAAPGGKTMQLAAMGARVFAADHSGPRLKRLRENLERTKLQAAVLEQDILEWRPPNLADRVLLDAPCSATGTVRRNPDLLWTSRETQVPDLVRLQARMLDKALHLTKPGGVLVYAVCSLLPEEGEEQIDALLERRDNAERIELTESDVAGLPVINKRGEVRCLPHKLADVGGMDGFFIAKLRRKA